MNHSRCIVPWLLVPLILSGCGSKPHNEISLKDISLDYPRFIGKTLTLQVRASEPGSYFSYAFAGRQADYWAVEVSSFKMGWD